MKVFLTLLSVLFCLTAHGAEISTTNAAIFRLMILENYKQKLTTS